jgi:transcriptional regulator GlxA family with amidase domain
VWEPAGQVRVVALQHIATVCDSSRRIEGVKIIPDKQRSPNRIQNVIFILFPGCEVLDLAGPLQTFHDANACGAKYRISLAGTSRRVDTAQLLSVTALPGLPKTVQAGDLIVVPGHDLRQTSSPASLHRWLREAFKAGGQICAICTGAFVLGEAGLLDRRSCTTHWKRLDELQRRFPLARVERDRLFVTDGPVTTSAGVASGVDVALWFVEQHCGRVLVATLAREMVVHIRRDGHQKQASVYLDFRSHFNSGVHIVQDYLITHVKGEVLIPELSKMAQMSTRSLTRAFRGATGLSIAEFRNKVRLEVAREMLAKLNITIDAVAEESGFNDSRHFRRAWKAAFGMPPSRSKMEPVA